MSLVTDEMVDAYKTAFDDYMRNWTVAADKDAARYPGREATRAGLAAAVTVYLAGIQAEPVAFVSKRIIDAFDVSRAEMVDAMLFPRGSLRPSEECTLFTTPVPPSPVSVEKVLEADRDSWRRVAERLEGEKQRLMEALEPFAKQADEFAADWPDTMRPVCGVPEEDPEDEDNATFTLGQLRSARDLRDSLKGRG